MAESNAPAPYGDEVPIEPDEIQFDQAEYATTVPGGPTCGACKRAIVDEYFEINGQILCAACRQSIETVLRSGSPFARLIKALVFGSVAAAVGAVIYYVILRTTGYNIGLVAVLVGFMVGGAVRRGTGNRGGLFYQLLAVFLTYTAIGAMHLPFVFEEPDQPEPKDGQANAVPNEIGKTASPVKVPPKAVAANAPARALVDIPANPFADAPAPAPAANGKAAAIMEVKKDGPDAEEAEPKMMMIPLLLAVFLFIIYASPVLHAVQAPISGLIFGFALWEAWKINKKVHLAFNGPFRVNSVELNVPPREVDDGG